MDLCARVALGCAPPLRKILVYNTIIFAQRQQLVQGANITQRVLYRQVKHTPARPNSLGISAAAFRRRGTRSIQRLAVNDKRATHLAYCLQRVTI